MTMVRKGLPRLYIKKLAEFLRLRSAVKFTEEVDTTKSLNQDVFSAFFTINYEQVKNLSLYH